MDSTQIQTIVVHVDQLTPDNMLQLAQAGYTVVRDPSLLIFGRNLNSQQDQPVSSTVVEGEVLTPVAPTPIHSGNSTKKSK